MSAMELLAPAGNRERLEMAFRYGADAAYLGGKQLGLRSFAENFTIEEMTSAATFAHSLGKKIYVTVNAFIKNSDFPTLESYLKELSSTAIDALIISDPAVLITAKELAPNLEIHISTQANTLNYKTAKFWHELGAKRVILARELSLNEIKQIRDNTPPSLELEAFVHGAMCISYSGRCLLSKYYSGRDGNRGECNQPCRYSYQLKENRSGNLYDVEQDELGTYVLNSKDMMMLEHLNALQEAGICSLKIEGRMKTVYYVASVINAYAMALKDLSSNKPINPLLIDELHKVSHRPYSTGFFIESNTQTEATNSAGYIQTYDFVAKVLSYDSQTQIALIEQRNRFFVGDELEVLSPFSIDKKFIVEHIENESGEIVQSAPHPQQKLYLKCPVELKEMDILRKKL